VRWGWGYSLGDGASGRRYGMWNSQRLDREEDKVETVKNE
jgi:N-acetylglucosamine kinase-like BadF-type ATPase